MLLVVKAPTAEEAKQFALHHGISVYDVAEIGKKCEWETTSGRFGVRVVDNTEAEHIVARWFCAAEQCLPRTGYPYGTLLWYKEGL